MNKEVSFENFADYFTRGAWSKYVTRLYPGHDKVHTLVTQQQPAGSFPDPGFDEFCIQLVTHGTPNCKVAFGGEAFHLRATPGVLVVAPPNVDAEYEIDASHGLATLTVHKDLLHRFKDQCDQELPADFGQLHSQSFFDPIVETLILRMLEHAQMEHPVSDLFLDDATNMILTSLFHRRGAINSSESPVNPLTSIEVQKVAQLVDDRLEENLTIASLASITSLSDFHFARAFKAATGQSPHQFVLSRRITRAKDLLENSRLPLAQVAVSVGFSSQSHMTDVFRKKVGTTPGQLRRELQN
ncbi:helix-turn-helix domain-containing protein [Leisingera sp. D0M16]|uniref:AraC family transcriptional regulator n=1 Tax=Leisingera coralii TaxID=3351347 RepID=UPI003B79399C